MTLRARIFHDSPGYPKALKVQRVHPLTLAWEGPPVIVRDGEDFADYVHGSVAMLVTEIDVPEDPSGAGGPGEE